MLVLSMCLLPSFFFILFFFFNDTATTEIYTLSLHDALPICNRHTAIGGGADDAFLGTELPGNKLPGQALEVLDRKSTRLNSSHRCISYAVFCLKKKKKNIKQNKTQKIQKRQITSQ